MGEDMYCGIGKIPKGKVRGTPEFCIQTNQIRYYGIEPVDESLIDKLKNRTSDLTAEKLKLKKIQDNAKILIRDVKKLQILMDDESLTDAQRSRHEKKMDELIAKRDKLVKQLKKQSKIVENSVKEEEKRKKRVAKKSAGKKSGSKTSRK